MAPQLQDQDIELLSQYIDGELPPAASRRLEERLRSEPALQRGLIGMEELNQRLRDALDERASLRAELYTLIDAAAQPQVAPATATVVPFPQRQRHAVPARSRLWPAAMAASLVGAVALGLVVGTGQQADNGLPGNDRFVSAALDTQPSGAGWVELDDGRELQAVLTFPHQDGRWCREYLMRGGENDWRAVACRDGGRWVTQAAGLEAWLDAGDAYTPAGASDAAPVAVFISEHAADIALGTAAEAELLASWRR